MCAASALLFAQGMSARAAAPARPDSRTSPRGIALTVSDMTGATGLHFVATGAVLNNAQVGAVEHVPQSTMSRYRITGYQTSLSSPHSPGVINVADSIGLYKSPAGAQWQYGIFTAQNKPLKGSRSLALKGIGNEERAYTFASKSLSFASVFFQRGVYTARIDIVGHGSQAALLLKLAAILDGRMRTG
jgi:hypothetical protein